MAAPFGRSPPRVAVVAATCWALAAAGGCGSLAATSGRAAAGPCRRSPHVSSLLSVAVWPWLPLRSMVVPPLALSAVGSGLERGGGESLGSACGSITMTPLGALYLFEGVILPPFFSLSCLPSG